MPRPRASPDTPLSPLARRIAARAKALGLIAATLAERSGIPPQTLSRLLTGQQESLRGDASLTRLAHVLKTTPAWLEGAVTDPAIPPQPPSPRSGNRAVIAPRPRLSPDALLDYEDDAREALALQAGDALEPLIQAALAKPFLGTTRDMAAGQTPVLRDAIPRFGPGANGRVALDETVGSLARPLPLTGCRGAYAITAGTGLEPRYRAHEIVVAAPGLLVQAGDWVVAVTGDPSGRAGIGRLGHIGRLLSLRRAHAIVAIGDDLVSSCLPIDRLIAVHPIVVAGEADLSRWAKPDWRLR
ncbi:helix-turn-helix domain-containing protein [Methylobacterium haplocladii]|uniref:HTH cro/C1-type domain-containing protein n=2 Tax=Methylobacterium haplocladii TaxID=1176176 RepID=A0A512IMS5_9HYPH|nr:helix-turn-helix transcriptional regulator [Methylobacterium haplocladii]GEO98932.1 hypothetical protein MHA02_13200 [Methylobacterium haplocladii]GJD85267.1 hypothetical protein HPGCJGGD_3154 [Methylobacterium haplocladii]GLS58078.1 hypothetical protein GCM10007887_07340 [Methylobacterium haplocladii]